MLHKYLFILIQALAISSCAQVPAERPHCNDQQFDRRVSQLIDFSVPVIGVDELKNIAEKVVLLDAREKEEFEISHIESAQQIGYKKLNLDLLNDVPKDQAIVLYCSIGYRSEKIGKKLQKMGYTKVYNLYGSIFEWINQGNTVVDKAGQPTDQIHTYNKKWSKWVEDGKAVKVW